MRLFHCITSKVLLPAIIATAVSSCNSNTEVPFPDDHKVFLQPVAKKLVLSEPQKFAWSDSVTNVVLPEKHVDFDKLSVGLFDSAGFMPFGKQPQTLSFDWNTLPSAPFDYDNLPVSPLKLETHLLPAPEVVKMVRPILKNNASELLYELGDPLASKNIISLLESKDGSVWIATQQNLYKYNGVELSMYLPFNNIIFLLEDKQGQVWVASSSGNVAIVNTKAGTVGYFNLNRVITRIIKDDQDRVWASTIPGPGNVMIIDLAAKTIRNFGPAQNLSTNNSMTTGMVQDEQGNLWIGSREGGLNIIDFKNKRVRYFTKQNGLFSDSLSSSVLVKEHDRVWACSYTGQVQSIDIKQGIIKKYGIDQSVSLNIVTSMLLGKDGNIWVGKNSGLKPGNAIEIIDFKNDKIKIIGTTAGLAQKQVQRLMQTSDGTLWVGASNGVTIIAAKNDYGIRKIKTSEVTAQLEMPGGKIWTAFLNDGLQVLDTATHLVRYLTTADGLSNGLLQGLVNDSGKVIVVTSTDLNFVDFADKKITVLSGKQGLLPAPTSVTKAKDGKLWISFNGAGINVFDPLKKTIYKVDTLSALGNLFVSSYNQDLKGDIWIGGSAKGLVILDTKNSTSRYIKNIIPLRDVASERIMINDKSGNVWIGASFGLFMINASRDSIIAFSKKEGLLSETVLSVLEHNGKIYAGTNRGLNVITPPAAAGGQWKVDAIGNENGVFKEAQTLVSDIITSNGEYWWGDRGLTIIKYPGREGRDTIPLSTFITHVSLKNRMQYYTANPWGAAGNLNDTLWSADRETAYYKGAIPADGFSINDGAVKWDSIYGVYNLPANLTLPFSQNYIQFHFAQTDPNHLNNDTLWYKYILEGIDKKWSENTMNTSSESYLNLQAGKYTFRVASLYKGKWSKPDSFSFTVLSPWWKSWWAYLIYVLVFAYVVWQFIQYRSRWLQKENRILEEKVAHRTGQLNKSIEELKATQRQLIQSEKMASLGELTAGIAHEIQNPLNFINNFSEVNTELIDELQEEITKGNLPEAKSIAAGIKENEQKINHHGKRADGIVKGMLQHSRSTSAVKEPADINKLADEYLRLAYHGLRAKDKSFNATLKTDFDESIGNILIVPQDIGRVMLNLITNAFYATSERKKAEGEKYEPMVTITTSAVSSPLGGRVAQVKVSDNGGGIPAKILEKIFQPFFTTKPTGQGTGLGLSLSYDIVKAHGGELKVETKEGEGTTFTVQLPVA